MAPQQDPLSGRYVPPAPEHDDRSSDEIRRDIERERRDLDATVDELQHRLSPANLVDDLWETTKRRLGDGGGELAQAARRHKVPLALIGAGLGWLIVEGSSGRSVAARRGTRKPNRGPAYQTGEVILGREERGSEIEDKAHALREGARETIAEVEEKAHEVRERASEAAQRMGNRVREGSGQVRESFTSALDSSPLALGGAAFALGVVSALLLPRSHWEDEAMGPARDRLVEQATERGEALAERGAHVAEKAARSASEALDEQRDEPLAERLVGAVRKASETARDEAHREGRADPEGDGAVPRATPGSEQEPPRAGYSRDLSKPGGGSRDH
jgi:hypothetical protein